MSKTKKILIIVGAVVLAAAIIAGVAFSVMKSKKNDDSSTTTTTAAESDTLAALVTASYTRDDVTLYDDVVWEAIAKNPDRWGNSFTSSYGMSDEEKASCLESVETGEWICCQVSIIIDNSANDKAVSYTGLKIDNNGENGVYMAQSISSTFETVAAGGKNQIVQNIFVHNADLSLEEIRDYVALLDVQVICGDEITEFPDDDSPLIPEDKIVYVYVVAE